MSLILINKNTKKPRSLHYWVLYKAIRFKNQVRAALIANTN